MGVGLLKGLWGLFGRYLGIIWRVIKGVYGSYVGFILGFIRSMKGFGSGTLRSVVLGYG